MSDPDPRFLPGLSSRGLWRAVNGTIFAALGLLVLTLPILFIVNASHDYTSAFGIGVLLALGVVILIAAILLSTLLPAARIKQRRELDSGYTTLMPEFDQVDGIDPATKQIARPAKTAPSTQPRGDRITSGAGGVALETGRTPFQIALRRRAATSTTVGSFIVLIGSVYGLVLLVPVARPSQVLLAVLFLLVIAALCVVITVPIVVMRFVPGWYYTARLSEATSVPVYQATPSNSDLVGELVGAGAPTMPGSTHRSASYLICEGEHLVLYNRNGTELDPYLVVPRSRIVEAHVGSSALGTGGASVSAPVLTILKDNGTELKITFSLTAPSWLSGRKRFLKDSQAIVDWVSTSSA
jgi:hypothetical protein